ncbi:pentapeptide repeat-containing protein, partial [Burkholderia sp. Bp8986]|uniref:pentapeptide repeat-containing protein n=1 Tax=Burkholderia sp. Bp8986 TaxID=2184550 RepID=UPI00163A32A0
MNILVACGARLQGTLLVDGRQFRVGQGDNATRFIDIPLTNHPRWRVYLEDLAQSRLGSVTARQLDVGYAQALDAVGRGEIAPVDKESLSHIIFSGADFTTAVFREVDFSGLDLTGANLRGARFEGCLFTDTELRRSNLVGCIFVGCMFENASIMSANAQASVFESCSFITESGVGYDSVCSAQYANLTSARFDRCHFNDFSFEHAILENAQIA